MLLFLLVEIWWTRFVLSERTPYQSFVEVFSVWFGMSLFLFIVFFGLSFLIGIFLPHVYMKKKSTSLLPLPSGFRQAGDFLEFSGSAISPLIVTFAHAYGDLGDQITTETLVHYRSVDIREEEREDAILTRYDKRLRFPWLYLFGLHVASYRYEFRLPLGSLEDAPPELLSKKGEYVWAQ